MIAKIIYINITIYDKLIVHKWKAYSESLFEWELIFDQI